MHRLEWAQLLVDNAACHKVMAEIWGSKDYVCKGGGGDFVLPGCPNIQPLHEDMVSIRLQATFLAGLRPSHTDGAGQRAARSLRPHDAP